MGYSEHSLAERQYGPIPRWQQFICGLYGLGAMAHRGVYQAGLLPTTTLPVPVISVGNLTVGGTGKTPVTIALAQYLITLDKRVVVLSRGYRARQRFLPGQTLTPAHGDEPFCIQHAVPQATVWVGSNRVALAKQAIAQLKPDVILLDDGHQHYKLHKSLDVVLIDAKRGVGNGHCLPFGPLRHPLPTFPPENLLWVYKNQQHQEHNAAAPLPLWPGHTGMMTELTTRLLNADGTAPAPQPVVVMTGVAYPAPLLDWLNRQGYTVRQHLPYADHADFNQADWLLAAKATQDQQAMLVVTQKDWVKAPEDLQAKLASTTAVADLVACLPSALLTRVNALFSML